MSPNRAAAMIMLCAFGGWIIHSFYSGAYYIKPRLVYYPVSWPKNRWFNDHRNSRPIQPPGTYG